MRSTPTPSIPTCAWKRRFDEKTPFEGSPIRLTWAIARQMYPAFGRVLAQMIRDKLRGRPSILIAMARKATPTMGVPLGGLGGGTITRGWRGDFVRWQMRPGIYHYGAVPVDRFSLWVGREGAEPRALVLSPRPQGGLDEAKTTYHALFPRAWTVYEEPAPGITLVCRQISPVIPDNYRESSYPVSVFVWSIVNTGTTAADVALMFTFQNGIGVANDLAGGHSNRAFEIEASRGDAERGDPGRVVGVELRHVHRQRWSPPPGRGRSPGAGERSGRRGFYEDPLAFAIATLAGEGIEASQTTTFVSEGARRGAAQVWDDFAADGRLGDPPSDPSPRGLAIAAALAARVHVPPGETREIVFSLAWDMPVARFGSGSAWYRRYTRFYGREGTAAPVIARDALLDYPAWESQIEAWQKPILDDPDLPDWYKAALFNETYYLVDGGTIWTAGKVPDREQTEGKGLAPSRPAEALPEPSIGHFAYLESHEYLMYNTYDVHFTASFALARLWPQLELSLQRDIAKSLQVEHPETLTFIISGQRGPRKLGGVIPHDLGSPVEDPWRLVNAYDAQDVSRWKDLGPKFVLQIYRDWMLTHDQAFLGEVWPAVDRAMTTALRFDRDGDGLIENEGFPDQTYDVWSAEGPSAYSGGLWLGALAAAAAMAAELGHPDRATFYRDLLGRAQTAYEARLWNGRYYDYDASRNRHHDSIMADQMCGPWFALASGLGPVVPEEHFRSALREIFELNVMGWRPRPARERGRRAAAARPAPGPGDRGAVNGMRPDGRIDRTCLQSAEVWTGTTFTLAAALLRAGLTQEAFATAHGIYVSLYRDYGLWFQTPEAISVDGVYRALGYMRPLAIWALQWEWALSPRRQGQKAQAHDGRASQEIEEGAQTATGGGHEPAHERGQSPHPVLGQED